MIKKLLTDQRDRRAGRETQKDRNVYIHLYRHVPRLKKSQPSPAQTLGQNLHWQLILLILPDSFQGTSLSYLGKGIIFQYNLCRHIGTIWKYTYPVLPSPTRYIKNAFVYTVVKFLSHVFAGITNDLIQHNDFPFNMHLRFYSCLVSLLHRLCA